MSVVLIVGGTGLLGRWTTRQLVADGYEVHAVVRNIEKALKVLPSSTHLIEGSLEDRDCLRKAVDSLPKLSLVHQSAGNGEEEIGMTSSLLSAIEHRKDVVFSKISSFNVGADTNDGRVKKKCEDLIIASGHPYLLWRSGWFTEVAPMFKFENGKGYCWKDLIHRSFISASDLAIWHSKAFNNPVIRNKAFYVQNEEVQSFESMIQKFHETTTGSPVQIEYTEPPNWGIDMAAMMRKVGEEFIAQESFDTFGKPKYTIEDVAKRMKEYGDL